MALKKPLGLYAGEIEGFSSGDAVDVLYGGTGGNTPLAARISLGLNIGSDIQGYSAELAALAALTTTGIIARTASGTYVPRTIIGTAGRTVVTNGDGVAGAPSFDLALLADSGTGTLLKFTRDGYGRISGTATPTATDIGAIADTRYVRLDASTTLNSGVVITYNAATTTFGTNDLVPKNYVDAIAQGYAGDFAEARVTTTGSNITLTGTAPNTLDGVTLLQGDVILVRDQTTASQNGWYTVTTLGTGATGTWTRETGYSTSAQVFTGIYTYVAEGTTNGSNAFVLVTKSPITLNTTALSFVQTSGAGQIIAQNGITKSGNVLSGVTANPTRIALSAAGFDLAALTIGGSGTGTFTKVTVDTYGRVTSTATASPSDIGAQPASTELTGVSALATNGLVARTTTGTYTTRSLIAPVAGLTITNPDGVAGNPTLALANDLGAIEALNGTGFYSRIGTDTWAALAMTGTARVVVTNGNGVGGAPTFDLATGVISTPGTFNSVTVDTYGRVIAGTTVQSPPSTLQVVTNSQGTTISIAQIVYTDSTGAKLARADADLTRRVIGFVYDASILSTGNGNIATAGSITALTSQWDAVTGNTGGLTPNATYWASTVTAGCITNVAPSTTGWVQPVGVATSSTTMRIGTQGRSVKL